ncbi:TPA: hypothetical protein L4R02_001210 [Pseudomonas aeruginosa]|nr:hypothetical protein [Pseudomonas aeruginosa]
MIVVIIATSIIGSMIARGLYPWGEKRLANVIRRSQPRLHSDCFEKGFDTMRRGRSWLRMSMLSIEELSMKQRQPCRAFRITDTRGKVIKAGHRCLPVSSESSEHEQSMMVTSRNLKIG